MTDLELGFPDRARALVFAATIATSIALARKLRDTAGTSGILGARPNGVGPARSARMGRAIQRA